MCMQMNSCVECKLNRLCLLEIITMLHTLLNILYLLLYQETCSGGSCLSETTCTVNGATCECIDGYYPPETIDGTCTRK